MSGTLCSCHSLCGGEGGGRGGREGGGRKGGQKRGERQAGRNVELKVALLPPAGFVAVSDSVPAALHEVVVHQHQVVHKGKGAGSRASGGGDEVVQCGVHCDGQYQVLIIHPETGCADLQMVPDTYRMI